MLLCGNTDTKQRFPNSSCFGDHDVIKVFAIITFVHLKQALKIFMEFFFDFVIISPIVFISFYCKTRLALTYGIPADPVTFVCHVCISS